MLDFLKNYQFFIYLFFSITWFLKVISYKEYQRRDTNFLTRDITRTRNILVATFMLYDKNLIRAERDKSTQNEMIFSNSCGYITYIGFVFCFLLFCLT